MKQLKIGPLCTSWTFYVSKGATRDVLLGMDFVVAHRQQLHLNLKDGSLLVIPDSLKDTVVLGETPTKISNSQAIKVCVAEPKEPLNDGHETANEPECFIRYNDLSAMANVDGALISCGKWVRAELDLEDELLTVLTVTANSPEEQEQLQQLKASFPADLLAVVERAGQLFNPPDTEPPQREVKHSIKLVPDAVPVKRSPYPMSPKKLTAMHEIMTDLITSSWVEPSNSPWGAPTIMVPKKIDVFRLVVDFRDFNSVTINDSYPLPHLEVLLHRAGQAKFFSKIDLASGFHQIKVDSASRPLTAFRLPEPVEGCCLWQ